MLANWPSFKQIVCSTHNNIHIEIPSHPCVLLNRTVLCNCIIEAENNFLLESIAAYDPDSTDMDILPISLESDDFDKELLAAPEMLRELVENYKSRKLDFDKQYEKLEPEEDFEKETSIFDHLASNIFIFVMALISLIFTIIVIMLLFKGTKMQALITNLAMQKCVKALTKGKEICSNYEYWIKITWLSLILLGIIFLIIEKAHKMPIF